MRLPQFHLLYFKELLDVAFIKFFEDFNDQFVKIGDEYHLGQSLSLQSIEDTFKKTIDQLLNEIATPYDVVNAPDFYIIIGACQPKDNFLLKFKREDFPKKLDKLLSSQFQLKYLLKEKDIRIDIVKFNEACCNVFNSYFCSSKNKSQKNVIFLTHKNLDCYSMFKMVKCMLGKTNCTNLKVSHFSDVKAPIVAVNELIDRSIHCKAEANRDSKFKKIYKEVKQYLDLKTSRELMIGD